MKLPEINLNQVKIAGMIDAPVSFSYEMYGEPFFESMIKVPRKSGAVDRIPIVVSGRNCRVSLLRPGKAVSVSGKLRSYNCVENGRSALRHRVFAEEVSLKPPASEKPGLNEVKMNGYICTRPSYRETGSSRRLTTFLFAVNRPCQKTDYIPCVCWGRTAVYLRDCPPGTYLDVCGRLQERVYHKHLNGQELYERHVWELSVYRVSCLELRDISA